MCCTTPLNLVFLSSNKESSNLVPKVTECSDCNSSACGFVHRLGQPGIPNIMISLLWTWSARWTFSSGIIHSLPNLTSYKHNKDSCLIFLAPLHALALLLWKHYVVQLIHIHIKDDWWLQWWTCKITRPLVQNITSGKLTRESRRTDSGLIVAELWLAVPLTICRLYSAYILSTHWETKCILSFGVGCRLICFVFPPFPSSI